MQQRDARTTIDIVTAGCLALIMLGWFGMNTLVTTLGPMTESVRFYEMLAVLRHPALLFIGVGSGHVLETLSFSLLCLLVVAAAFLPPWSQRRNAWLAGLLPLALMLTSFALLYRGGPAWQPDASSPAHLFGDTLVRFANGAMARVSSHAASHVGLGWGGALALLASAALAIRSTGKYLAARAARATSQRSFDDVRD